MLIFPLQIDEEYWVALNIEDIRPNIYEISNYGNVRRIADKYPIKAQILLNEYGAYRIVNIVTIHGSKPKKYLVHRLVGMMFVPNPNNYPQINHVNNNGMDECYRKLCWTTGEYNTNYQYLISKCCLPNLENYKIYCMIENGLSNKEIIDSMNHILVDDEYVESIRESFIRNNPPSEYAENNKVVNSSKYPNHFIVEVCKLFQSGKSYLDYMEIANILGVDVSDINKRNTFYAYCANIYKRKHHTHISKDFNW